MKLTHYAILIYPSRFRNDEHMFSPILSLVLIVGYEKIHDYTYINYYIMLTLSRCFT